MRQFNLVFTVLVMFFALQGQAQNKKAKVIKKHEMTLTLKRATAPVTGVKFASRAPTANVGSTSCAAKNKAHSPFSKEGKLTQVSNRTLPTMANRSATGNL
ncbi:MAG: hypothetical protein AABY64_01885 [Bdellovibrionota bacterium]